MSLRESNSRKSGHSSTTISASAPVPGVPAARKGSPPQDRPQSGDKLSHAARLQRLPDLPHAAGLLPVLPTLRDHLSEGSPSRMPRHQAAHEAREFVGRPSDQFGGRYHVLDQRCHSAPLRQDCPGGRHAASVPRRGNRGTSPHAGGKEEGGRKRECVEYGRGQNIGNTLGSEHRLHNVG